MLALTPSPARAFLEKLAAHLERLKAIVAVSAHFSTREPVVVSDPQPAMIYDFGGFPSELYQIVYPAPGDSILAEDVATLISAAGMQAALVGERGFDHGSWVPLSLVWPGADVPIVQLSIQPLRDPAHHLALGAR